MHANNVSRSQSPPYDLVIHRTLSLSPLSSAHCRHIPCMGRRLRSLAYVMLASSSDQEQQTAFLDIPKYIASFALSDATAKARKLCHYELSYRYDTGFSPSVTCFYGVYILSLDIDGCCGASTPVIHCLPCRRLVGVAVFFTFHHLDLGFGPYFPFGGGMYSQRFLGGLAYALVPLSKVHEVGCMMA